MRNERDEAKGGRRVSGIIEMAKACTDIYTTHRSLDKGGRIRQGEDKPNSLEGEAEEENSWEKGEK